MAFGVIIIAGVAAVVFLIVWAGCRAAHVADDLADAFNDWCERRSP